MIAVTVLPVGGVSENRYSVVLVDAEGKDILIKESVVGTLSEVEEKARQAASENGVPFKKHYMIHQRINNDAQDTQMYLTQCNTLGKMFYRKYLNLGKNEESPPSILKTGSFNDSGWDNFVSGWESAYQLTNIINEGSMDSEIADKRESIHYDRNVESVEIPMDTIASKVGMDNIEGRAIKINPDIVARLSERGILVDLHIGRWRARKSLSSHTLGVESNKPEVQEFISTHINFGDIRLIPKDIEAEFVGLESRSRSLLEAYSIRTLWGRFLPAASFQVWYKENQELKEKYFKLGETLAEKSRDILAKILVDIEGLAQEVYTRETNLLTPPPSDWLQSYREYISNSFPSALEIKNSFQYIVTFAEVPISSFSRWKEESVGEDTVSKMKALVTSSENFDQNFSAEQFYKDYLVEMCSDLRSKLSIVYASASKSGKLQGKGSASISKAIGVYRARRDEEDTLPALMHLDSLVTTIDSIMIQKSTKRDYPVLLKHLETAITALDSIVDEMESM